MGTENKNDSDVGKAILFLLTLLAVVGAAVGYAVSKPGFESKATIGGAACGVIVALLMAGCSAAREDDEDQN